MLKFKNVLCVTTVMLFSACLFGCGGAESEVVAEGNAVANVEQTTVEVALEATSESIAPTVDSSIANVVGNTANNICNGGKACIQGDLIYYVGKDKGDVGLYKMKADETSAIELRKGSITDINVVGNNIYFIEDGNIIKVDTLGQNEKIIKENCGASRICVTGDWIYYSTNVNSGMNNKSSSELTKMYKVKTSGVGDLLITDKRDITTDVKDFCIMNDTIYYMDAEGICKMSLEVRI